MRNLVQKHIILSFVLFSLAVTAFGQETGWEFDHLQGKVKTFAEYDYEFDISDSINHDEFMRQFYICGFDVDKMLRFADSIKTEKDSYYNTIHEYDSLGQFTKFHDAHYINEYDDSGRILKRSIVEEDVPKDTIFFEYDEVGRLVKRKYRNRIHHWRYDLDSRLLEYIYKDTEMDSVLILEKYDYDKDGVLKKKESFDNRKEGNGSGYYEYDSKGNVISEQKYDRGEDIPRYECKTRYKYDKNDSIIKETRKEVKWVNEERIKDTVWQEIDSEGRTVNRFGYTSTFQKTKRTLRSERIITRNTKGFPVEEVFEEYDNSASKPRYTNNKKYDELGRVVEETIEGVGYNPMRKKVIKYYKNTGLWEHYAAYIGKECGFDHESLFFYDDYGNCIVHIQWMPGAQKYEYYFNVYRYEYYE